MAGKEERLAANDTEIGQPLLLPLDPSLFGPDELVFDPHPVEMRELLGLIHNPLPIPAAILDADGGVISKHFLSRPLLMTIIGLGHIKEVPQPNRSSVGPRKRDMERLIHAEDYIFLPRQSKLDIFLLLEAHMHIFFLASQLIDIKKIFFSAPLIYGLLFLMSVAALTIWIYSLATFRAKDFMPAPFSKELRNLLQTDQYENALNLCSSKNNLLSQIMATGLSTRQFGHQVMMEAMKSEAKRASTAFWQRLSLLNDIVIIAPMLGLLGTVIGMFYAFYDVNRSVESINALFDGLGIAVGTTVFGLIVAILSMLFYTSLKYRVVRSLSLVENEALSMSSLMGIKV